MQRSTICLEVARSYLEVDFVKLFFGVAAIHIAEVLAYRVVKDQATERCVNDAGYLLTVDFPRHAIFIGACSPR